MSLRIWTKDEVSNLVPEFDNFMAFGSQNLSNTQRLLLHTRDDLQSANAEVARLREALAYTRSDLWYLVEAKMGAEKAREYPGIKCADDALSKGE